MEVNLSHLSFADDIVIFTDGTPESLRGTLQVFEEFASMSGLRINVAKSTVFAAGRGKQALESEAAMTAKQLWQVSRYLLCPPIISDSLSPQISCQEVTTNR